MAIFDLSNESLWNPVYAPLFRSKKKIKIIYGSRNSGKSEVAGQYAMVRMLDQKRRTKGIMVRKYHDKVREAQWTTVKELVDKYEWDQYFKFPKAPLGIEVFHGKNRLLSIGLADSGNAKSIRNPNWAWIEEGDELEEEDFRKFIMSIRGEDVEVVITLNAPREDHWIVRRFFPGTINADGQFTLDRSFESPDGMFTEVPSTDPDCFILHTCYKHNPFRGADVDAMMERERLVSGDEVYRTECLGLIGRQNLGSLWCRAFDRSKHLRKLQYRPDLPVHLTFDQNNLPYSTMLAIQIVPLEDSVVEIRVLKTFCYKPPSNSTEDLCVGFIVEFDGVELDDGTTAPSPEVYIYGDTTGRNETQKKERQELAHHYDAVKKHLAPYIHNRSMRVAASAPSIKGRQRFMTVLLNDGTFLRLVIDPSCKELIGDFEHLVEDENGGYIKKRVKDKETGQSWEEHGHCMDATINFLYQAFKDIYRKVAKV